MKKERVLVTGGTGVLGTYIVEGLLTDGFDNIEIISRSGKDDSLSFAHDKRVTFTSGDVASLHPLTEAIERSKYIIHAAAVVSFHPKRYSHMHEVNVEGTANVINIAIDSDVKKLIHISSIAALGRDGKDRLISEDTKWANSKYNSYYGITKYLAEQEVWRGHHEGLNVAIINPSLILGGKRWGKSSLKIFEKVYEGLPYYTAGSTGIVDAKDVSSLLIHLLKSEINGQRYIASGHNITYKELFQRMATSMNVKSPKKPAPAWMMSLFWRLEKVRSMITGNDPVVTRETVMSASNHSKYDNKKSQSLDWDGYTDLDATIQEYCHAYKAFRSQK